MTEIDYKTAFEELNTLNKAFEDHNNYMLPTLNPKHFSPIRTEDWQQGVVFLGLRTGQHYFLRRREIKNPNGYATYAYTPARRAKPVERTIIEWEVS